VWRGRGIRDREREIEREQTGTRERDGERGANRKWNKLGDRQKQLGQI